MGKRQRTVKEGILLGEFPIALERFEGLDAVFKGFRTKEFERSTDRTRFERVNRALLEEIQSAKAPCFLLAAVVDFIHRVNQEKVRVDYTFSNFEVWLNQFSGLTPQENAAVRCKIIGKGIPRDEYQVLFPVGMGKMYAGTHFVTGHGSPDLDTTIASFWGWVDAFGARVSEGRHIWNLPGGPPESVVELTTLFSHLFGKGVFQALAKTRTALSVSGIDLMTQKGLVRKPVEGSTLALAHEKNRSAVILIDAEGYYVGDWRPFDVEGVRQVIASLTDCLRFFANALHEKLISLFAKEKLTSKEFSAFVSEVSRMRLSECSPVKELSAQQSQSLEAFLVKVLLVKKGKESMFEEFARALQQHALVDFQDFLELLVRLKGTELFERSGAIVENRTQIFRALRRVVEALNASIQKVKEFVERLDVSFRIKTDVFGYTSQEVSSRADLEEIRSKIGGYSYVSITVADREGRPVPLGVVHATDLHKAVLGTVTVRDFCNREETKIPSYLQVISVIDHHKSSLTTSSAPVVWISDAQSSNVLVAGLAFEINDRYSTAGMSLQEIDQQISALEKKWEKRPSQRLLQRLLRRREAAQKGSTFFIDSRREYTEYLHFLYGILDDTDLLTKVSLRDVECVASLVNRLKSLAVGREVEAVDFDDLPKDGDFTVKAAERLVKNPDLYSLYRKMYQLKEEAVEENLRLAASGKPSTIFLDTKEQNGCCRVGQTKVFARNLTTLERHVPVLRRAWLAEAMAFCKERAEFDLHVHMVSTIASAEDLYRGRKALGSHKDEMWLWIPFTEASVEHLKSFLSAFRTAPSVVSNDLEVECLGKDAKEYEKIFSESFLPLPKKVRTDKGPSLAILRFNAGSINSRKEMVSPYLPKI